MDSEMAAWLRQQRENRGWSKVELARRLIQAGHAVGDTAVPELSGMVHNIHRWEREGGISERHKLHYCRALGIHPSSSAPAPAGSQRTPQRQAPPPRRAQRSRPSRCPRSARPPSLGCPR